MAININNINQNTNYNITAPKVEREYSGIKMAQTLQGTGNCGYLIPVLMREMIPSQKINVNFTTGIQFRPFVTNLLHEINGTMLHYFVPYRLLWDEWEDFITGGKNGTFTAELPNINKNGETIEKGSIEDFIGYPVGESLYDDDEIKLSAFPRKAYNLIWNEQIRNLDIQKEVDLNNKKLLKAQWDFDYFNTARIMQMRGVMPTIPLSFEEEHEITKLTDMFDFKTINFSREFKSYENNTYYWKAKLNDISQGLEKQTGIEEIDGYTTLPSYENNQNMQVTKAVAIKPKVTSRKLIENSGVNMNDLLIAIGITKYQVNNMRTKPRYMEQLKMRFGVSPTDARLQLPEYIGASIVNITTNPITQTAPTTSGSQQGVGEITGQAWGVGQNNTINYTAEEWGILVSLLVIKPRPTYELGAPRMWTKKTKFDFATPELANMLDVPLYKSELNYSKENRTTKKIFGWRGIYDEYRVANNIVANDLRPSAKQNLATYTLAQKLDENVELNNDFISCTPDMARIKQYVNQDDFLFYTQSNITTAIPLPVMSDPNEMVL